MDRVLPDIVEDVIPGDMMPYLPCLTDDDKEQILCEEENRGSRRAAYLLVDRLKRRRNGMFDFIRALSKTGCHHVVARIDEEIQKQNYRQPQP
ncbi:predicted protein [Nematostella vectensis]|uniref:Caspase recruitment domain-containing protein n=2 Tax=Nematostella vectensis TaxID=45351 RepID=A7RWA9_NEMVE|nr:predicted protein [Nematostella vectensis]|eukprot:XP_001636344.1 predicted protein [Nematostella vectensis]